LDVPFYPDPTGRKQFTYFWLDYHESQHYSLFSAPSVFWTNAKAMGLEVIGDEQVLIKRTKFNLRNTEKRLVILLQLS